ncbi:MAG: AccI family restriction endonuclease [Crocosphaera sp.]|nr:AccI family restriction endonuclease [Crocosphaera sp.]
MIQKLIEQSPLSIDTEIQLTGKPPTMANSEFLTNKEQGDWAESVVYNSINEFSKEYFAIKYGRSESIAAGDKGFAKFYQEYKNELNAIGKKPDILIYKTSDFPDKNVDINNNENIEKAIAALEVRSSSFLVNKYDAFMTQRQQTAIDRCKAIRQEIISGDLAKFLENKKKPIYDHILDATDETFKELKFRLPSSWLSTSEGTKLTKLLKELRENIKILKKRDYLSITPKMEDIPLVNRWIQQYNVKHFYLQVFFDKGYIISFQNILELVADDTNQGDYFSIEKDSKNQEKTTIKINIKVGKEIISKIEMPEHKSEQKELDRGRLLFYVTFKGGKGYLDKEVFMKDIINA